MEIICAKCGTDNTQDSEFCKRCGAQIKDKEANPVHSAGETTQISEPKKADGPTQKSKEIYRTLVEQARDGIIVLQGGKINFANSYLTDLSGYSPQELLNSKFIQYIHPDEQEKVTATYTRRMKGENVPSVYESALLHKDGSRVEVEFNAHVTTFDGEPADLVIVRDITERKRLREERNRILNLSPDLICIAGLDGYFKYVNPAWENILGYPKEELCSKPFFDFIHPDDHAKNEAEVEKLASGHQTLDFENRYLHKDGSIRHILWVATPLPEEKLLYCIGRDITERKQAEEKFLQYQKRLKALALQLTLTEEKERRHIAADLHDHIGHSLALGRMQLDAVLKADSKMERTVLINDVSNILLQAIQDTKDLIFELSSPLMNEIGLASAISEWLEEYMERRYGLETELTDKCEDVSLDRDLRAILFRNVRELFTNIIKHARAKEVRVVLESVNDTYKIRIKDDGIGFDSEAEIRDSKQERGFGLFSIQERMADLGGSLEVLSQPGKGTQIIMSVPIKNSDSKKQT